MSSATCPAAGCTAQCSFETWMHWLDFRLLITLSCPHQYWLPPWSSLIHTHEDVSDRAFCSLMVQHKGLCACRKIFPHSSTKVVTTFKGAASDTTRCCSKRREKGKDRGRGDEAKAAKKIYLCSSPAVPWQLLTVQKHPKKRAHFPRGKAVTHQVTGRGYKEERQTCVFCSLRELL